MDKRVKERVRKMFLMGVTQRSEMRHHINIFVEENFPSVLKLDTSFHNVQGYDDAQTHTHGPGESPQSCKETFVYRMYF